MQMDITASAEDRKNNTITTPITSVSLLVMMSSDGVNVIGFNYLFICVIESNAT